MKVVAIVNPVAGAFRQHSALRVMLDRLRGMGIEVRVQTTRYAGHGRVLAREAAETASYVIAGGGDGTVREVVEGLAGTTAPLMIWPTGTENLVAKSLGFRARADLIPACITAGRTVRLDVGAANDEKFVVVAGAGFDAEVVDRLVRQRRGHITHLTYLEPIWRTFWTHRWPELRIYHNDTLWWQGRGMAFVGNMSRYSLGLPVVRDARPDDGLLDLLVLPCRNQIQLLGHSLRTLLACHVEYGGARYLRFTRLRIESVDPVPVEMDGDLAGALPLDIRVEPAALSVRLPPMV
ncbi:MAG TPA: diacylglycerol kinase family protein [Phycisphaerae bacterium]|nr:diacylglycerol kinase family protein [Phycisphaerae bacterium]HPZ99563.1 diacylglycerol kinase family protein [Phycisphaerae bacterium]